MESKRSIAQYIGKAENTIFVIPSYQRGYKWGVPHKDGKNDARVLVEDIVRAFNSHKAEYFIQGVTVYKKDNFIYLIDGQQRTTTVFLLLTAIISDKDERFSYLYTRNKEFRLEYKIRKSSHEFLENIVNGQELGSIDTQDKFYINTAYNQIIDALPEDVEAEDHFLSLSFKEYVLERVKMFYIEIDESQATDVFSMMNGAKAYMKVDELVKADFLSKVSSSDNVKRSSEQTNSIDVTLDILRKQLKKESTEEWENNAVRSRFAREWDKWIYWWNQEEVKAFFESGENPLGLLLPTFCDRTGVAFSNSPDTLSTVIKECQNTFIKDTKNAKLNFYELRELQKKFENLYRNTHSYNLLGIALSCSIKRRKKEIIDYFIDNYYSISKLKRFTMGILIDKKPDDEDYTEAALSIIAHLESNRVYLEDGVAAGGGYTLWDNEQKLYYYVNDLGFQMVETRACAIIETDDYGLVAMLPVGMSQICSVNWIPGLHVGQRLKRGDEMGFFQFGGSDIIMIFQRGIDVEIVHDGDLTLMGEPYARLRK